MQTYKGYFKPQNPEKYKGNPTRIVYRSRWELKYMSYLDRHPDVIYWQSEELQIPYISPIDGRVHRYFPDFLVKYKNSAGKVVIDLIEIKPKKQTIPPVKPKRMTRSYINEVVEWGKNQAKWKAAREYCADHLWNFKIFTEAHLGIKW